MIFFLDFDGVLHPDGFRYPLKDFRYFVGFDDAAERALRRHFEAAVPKRPPTGTDP